MKIWHLAAIVAAAAVVAALARSKLGLSLLWFATFSFATWLQVSRFDRTLQRVLSPHRQEWTGCLLGCLVPLVAVCIFIIAAFAATLAVVALERVSGA